MEKKVGKTESSKNKRKGKGKKTGTRTEMINIKPEQKRKKLDTVNTWLVWICTLVCDQLYI